MIYLDSSVALTHILSQGHVPDAFWRQSLTSSRLLQYEVWNRLHAYQSTAYRHRKARNILRLVGYQEMIPTVLVRALRPFHPSLKTLDSLHLATMDHLRTRGLTLTLASYDDRFLAAAQAVGFTTLKP